MFSLSRPLETSNRSFVDVAKSHEITVRFATCEDLNAFGFYGPIWVDRPNGIKDQSLQEVSESQ